MTRPTVRDILIALALAALIVAARLLPHPVNAAPALSVSLFAGFLFVGRRWMGLAIAAAGMLISDAFIGTYNPFYMALNYALLATPTLAGAWLRPRPRVLPVAGASIGAAVFFFITSNFGVWAFGTDYPRTSAGLLDCYVKAIPFFKWSALSALVYSAILFGGCVLMTWRTPRATAAAPVAA